MPKLLIQLKVCTLVEEMHICYLFDGLKCIKFDLTELSHSREPQSATN